MKTPTKRECFFNLRERFPAQYKRVSTFGKINMLSNSCLICSIDNLSKNVQTATENTFGGSHTNLPNVNCHEGAKESKNVQNQLQVVFLLRKLLEIPEDTCCLLLQHFGNPNLWIECCDTCSDLVQKCHTAFEQIISLQKYYEKLRLDIKNTILKSQKTSATESKCDAIVRSYVITQDISRFIKSSETVPQNKNFGNSASNPELRNGLTLSSHSLGEQQPFNGRGASVVMSEINTIEIDNCKEVPIPFTETIAGAAGFVNSFRTISKNTKSFSAESLNVTDADPDYSLMSTNSFVNPHPYICETPVVVEKINGFKSEVENAVPLNVDVQGDEIIGSFSTISKFQQNLQVSSEVQNSQPKRNGTTQELNNAVKLFPNNTNEGGFTVDSHSYILPDDNFGTHSDSGIHHREEMPEESKVGNKNYTLRMKSKREGQGSGKKKLFECDICGKEFHYSHTLRIHRKSHKERKKPLKAVCNICGKSFTSSQKLSNHMLCHTGKKIVECNICGLICDATTKLIIHLRSHTGEKPYVCNLCGYSFTLKTNLKRHLMTHTGERPFPCDFCGKSFIQKLSLEQHRRIHTGEKPFECEICGALFRIKHLLKKHLESHN